MCTNDVEASRPTRKDRTKCAPLPRPPREQPKQDARPFTAHLDTNACNTSLKCTPNSSARCRRRSFLSSLLPTNGGGGRSLRAALGSSSRHPLGSSSSLHTLHKLIVLSIGNSCRSFRGPPQTFGWCLRLFRVLQGVGRGVFVIQRALFKSPSEKIFNTKA